MVVAVAAALLGAGCGQRGAGEPPPHGLITLTPDGHGDYASLAQAVRQAPEGATIVLAPGVYRVAAPLDVYRSLTLRGAGADRTTVIGTTAGHLLGFSGNGSLTAVGIAFRHVSLGPESDPADIALFRGGRVELSDCRFEGASSGRECGGLPRRGGRAAAGRHAARGCTTASSRTTLQAGVVCEPHARPVMERVRFVNDGRPGLFVEPGRTGPTDPAELARFLDATVPGLLGDWRVPGAVVVVVKNGRVLAQKGYGLADIATGEPVDPERTLFRLASVTKVFTATAVLQLAEQGKVKLGVDAQVYLPGLPLPRTFSRPVTVADLFTHTSGFDERTIGTAAPSGAAGAAAGPRADDRRRPSRVVPVRPVLQLLELQLRAGRSYRADGRRHAVRGVRDSRGSSGARDDRTHRSTPSMWPRPSWRPATGTGAAATTSCRRTSSRTAAAGQLYSTGADMARFMLCELQGGQLDGTRSPRLQGGCGA